MSYIVSFTANILLLGFILLITGCENSISKGSKALTATDTCKKKDDYSYFDYSVLSQKCLKVYSQGRTNSVQSPILLLKNSDSTLKIEQLDNSDLAINGHLFKKRKLFYYCLDSIAEIERVKHGLPPEMDANVISEAVLFDYKDVKYLAVFGRNWAYTSSWSQNFLILFRFENKIPIYIFSKKQSSLTINCFNDFNNDGLLDYADWYYANDSIVKPYSIRNDSLILDPKHYLILKYDNKKGRFGIKIDKWYR